MRRQGLLIGLGVAVAVAACSRPVAPAPPPAQATAAVNPPAQVQTYACEDGRSVEAGYAGRDIAVVTVGGHAATLKAAPAADGVRYVGFGLQWWTKGLHEARLAKLKSGEEVASDRGVACHAAAAPPPPGSPGGLPDDGTPLAEGPIDPRSAQGAGQIVQRYFGLVEQGRLAEAAELWDGAPAPAPVAGQHAQVGAPGALEGAAGSSYVEVPVVLYGEGADGRTYHRQATVTLRRVNDVPGSTAAQRRWRIEKMAEAR